MTRYGVCGCLLTMLMVATANAQALPRRIEVRGRGEIKVPADQVVFDVTVLTTGDEVATTRTRNDTLTQQVFALAKSLDQPQPVIESTELSFRFENEVRGFAPGEKGQAKQQTPRGKESPFEAEPQPPVTMMRQISLRFESLSQAVELLEKLTALDAVHMTRELRLSTLHCSVKDPDIHQQKARKLAVAAAQSQAALLAEASKLTLGAAVEVVDESAGIISHVGSPRRHSSLDPFDPFGNATPRPETDRESSSQIEYVAFQSPARKAGDKALDLESLPPAQITITASVRVTFEASLPK